MPDDPAQPERPLADAASLFEDAPAQSPSKPEPSAPARPAAAGDAYDVEAAPQVTRPAVPPPLPPDDDDTRTRRSRTGERPRDREDTAALVDPPWSRWGEWGPTLILLAIVGLAVLGLAYLAFDVDNLAPAVVILAIGGFAWILLSYPIVITLERPVRITPEQAVKDFYGALAHHRPHFRRMWYLLSSAGRSCSDYGSFEGFVRYWKARLAALRGDKASGFTPLVFQIADFKAEKSAGKARTEVAFIVNVFIRGKVVAGPIASIRVETGLVRGPDNQWYLDRGTLPG